MMSLWTRLGASPRIPSPVRIEREAATRRKQFQLVRNELRRMAVEAGRLGENTDGDRSE